MNEQTPEGPGLSSLLYGRIETLDDAAIAKLKLSQSMRLNDKVQA